jgi:hypothetical protein
MVFTFAVAVAEKLWLLKGLCAFAGRYCGDHVQFSFNFVGSFVGFILGLLSISCFAGLLPVFFVFLAVTH